MKQYNWHIFCQVVDNFGDIGVCWRLAQQLNQQGQQVTLWVDDLDCFGCIEPLVRPALAVQQVKQVQVCHWSAECEDFNLLSQAQVVIEAFACELPAQVITTMQRTQPLWLNLEYLSAEAWVEEVHGLPSPVHGLNKRFFFPGFTERTGGLLWQPELLTLACQSPALQTNTLRISLFAYENPQLEGLLGALSQHSHFVELLVPQGRISEGVATWLGEPLGLGQSYQRGSLTIKPLAFMSQAEYDHVLASCDLNFVRGEESFVRAQMLGLPFIWHIYVQQDDAHLVKLDAFIALYLANAPAELGSLLRRAFTHWNQAQVAQFDWRPLLGCLSAWRQHSQYWQQTQINHGDLCSNLVNYVENTL